MKLVAYGNPASIRQVGVLTHEGVVEISDLVAEAPLAPERERLLRERGLTPAVGGIERWLHLERGDRDGVAAKVKERLARRPRTTQPLDEVRLFAPIARPGKIVAVGRNYADHAKETGVKPFEQPRIIAKLPSSVTDPGAVVRKPAAVRKFDFEAELAVVMGEFASHVKPEHALDFVAGYTILNDLSAREFQFDVNPAQTTFAKSMDGFCPMGPCLVTADEIGDPQSIQVRCWVNDVKMQDANTADMLFPVATLIAYVSQFMTLEPGDVIATGTPAGIGAFRDPPQWLGAGDRIRMELSRIGVLENTIG